MKGHVHKYEAGLWTFGKRVNVIGFGPLKVIDWSNKIFQVFNQELNFHNMKIP